MKALAIALPFIIAALIFLFWATYNFGKRVGIESIDKVGIKKRDSLLIDASKIFRDLAITTDLDTDDIVTEKTRNRIDNWQTRFEGM